MLVVQSRDRLRISINEIRLSGKQIGFVPTMGALHEGHLSLIDRCQAEMDYCVCSIFVNPTQFDDQADLVNYPKTLDEDLAMLKERGVDMVFLPNVDTIYPSGARVSDTFDFHGLDRAMEGAHRQGHFDGVAQVVKILLELVQPEALFMGQKDYQQFRIISDMVSQLEMPVEVVMCPTIREEDGLAMSSRNRRLAPDERKSAVRISQILFEVRRKVKLISPAQLVHWALEQLKKDPLLKPEYFAIVNTDSLKAVQEWKESEPLLIATAVRLGEIRLIDNVVLQ